MTRLLVIPAAGRGSRLGGATPKPLVTVNGCSMLDHLAALYRPLVDRTVVIAHPSFAAAIRDWAAERAGTAVVEQAHPTGMLDAIRLAAPVVRETAPDAIWITWADQVGVLPATLERLAEAETRHPEAAMIFPTVETPDPYIHFQRNAEGRIVELRQRREGDAMPERGESDMGVFALRRAAFEGELAAFASQAIAGSGTGERNFLPFIPWLASRRPVRTIGCTDPRERVGINTPEDLAAVAAWLRARPARV